MVRSRAFRGILLAALVVVASACGRTATLEDNCGDGSCDFGESCETCPADCHCSAGSCGDDECQGDETDVSCPQDCGCAASQCASGPAPFGCYCDSGCAAEGDCCADTCAACGAAGYEFCS